MKRLLLFTSLLFAGCPVKPDPKLADPPATAAASTSNRFTFDTVMKLHDGQTYAQVVEIMGKPNRVMIGPPVGKKYTVKTEWGLPKGGPFVFVVFEDGQVTAIDIGGVDPPKWDPPSESEYPLPPPPKKQLNAF